MKRNADKPAKDEIAEGMAKAGKDEADKATGDAAKGQHGHGSDTGQVAQDMAESSSKRKSGRSGTGS